MDFTRGKYVQFLLQLKESGYEFITYADYCSGNLPQRFVILRHDVDSKPENSLEFAKEEKRLKAKASYYFRTVPESWNKEIILEIHGMGHEVGYHYESLATCNGNLPKAFENFKDNLEKLRQLTPVKTICMHGSPRSVHDNKDLWILYDYKTLDVIGEPYLSTDFSKVLYLTDTGRMWDGYKVSVRDKIRDFQEEWKNKGWSFHSTNDIISALQENRLPDQLMITTNPQRWCDSGLEWFKELILQNSKNMVKRVIVSLTD